MNTVYLCCGMDEAKKMTLIVIEIEFFSMNLRMKHNYWIWKLIFARSSGAITVLATPPAKAPQNKFITTVFTFDVFESVEKRKASEQLMQETILKFHSGFPTKEF